jgi:hypothetical protein
VRDFVLHTQPHAFKIDGDHPLPGIFGIINGGGRSTFDTRIIMRTIQPPVRLHSPSDQGLDFRGPRYISFDEDRLAAALLN